ncbi:DHA2 family efflux MFS transporter permease subunit [Phycicoccus sonneratiae]|uniref:DHA2 family efflux MFS transporter permease subunit n=1 Tax=Phycicoccus sonneratiae TaxID=2807628 RepID=A0ABS2CIL9_9MICO|nr:DHA2 family efflux MFS transporter permease subunit [Phycicoccus sonneraticus]MBM6399727.1 DHA2 family efflux MFS transporter permease subunit [Phycicoccus sonneraticus]
MSAATPTVTRGLPLGSPGGRWLLVASILGSALAGIDATVVNVALPAIGQSLDADFATLQWTVSAYALTLAAFILLGGVLGDRFGRRRVFVVGVVWFAAASLLCGAAPDAGLLVAARALQGVGAALLTPGSLAMIQASIAPEDRGRAIGAWSGLGGVATAIGPFLGGWLVQSFSWRWVFLVNVPLAAVVVALAVRHVPESRDPGAGGPVDVTGAVLGALALGGATYALISAGESGASPAVLLAAAVGVVAGTAFVVVERRAASPMLPLDAFRRPQFRAANLVTFVVYGGLGAVFLLLVVQLQVVSGFSPLAAGTALLPVTGVMLLLSSRSGALAARLGPRRQMAAGPVVAAVGVLLMLRLGPGASYLVDVLPAVLVLGLGLVTMVSPLTATALAAAPAEHAGMASGVNNAVARTAGLLAVAVVPAVAGLSGRAYDDPAAFDAGFGVAMWVSAAALAAGGVIAALTVRDDVLAEAPGDRQLQFCAGIGGPPLATRVDAAGHADCDPVPLVTTTLEDPMACTHLTDPAPPVPRADGCEECLRDGSTWVHLRLCQECGHVGCCDSSPGRHATAHAHDEDHPVIRSFEPGEEWFYCYVDDVALEVPDAPPAPSHH